MKVMRRGDEMLVVFLLAMTIAVFILVADRDNETNRWAGIMILLIGLGALRISVSENIMPYLQSIISENTNIAFIIEIVDRFFLSLCAYFFPYIMFMFSISYTNIFNYTTKRKITYISLIPILATYLLFIPTGYDYFARYYGILKIVVTIWVTPYILLSAFLLIYSYVRTKNPAVKQQKLVTVLTIIPLSILLLIPGYILPCFGMEMEWRESFWNVTFTAFFIVFIALSLRHGILGVRLRLQKYRLDNTIRAMGSGTVIMNHAVKNEIAKISVCSENIRRNSIDNSEIGYSIDTISHSTNHLLNLFNRVNKYMQDFAIEKTSQSITEIMEDSLKMMSIHIQDKNINIIKEYPESIILPCDGAHIREVLNNIIGNSIEAMDYKGNLKIKLIREKKKVILSVSDDGKGISKDDLPYVADPFFSTKKTSRNFGLGLSYCYTVMQKHGGRLGIESEKDKGTTIFLIFKTN